MATITTSQQRAHLFREMNKTRNSPCSSHHSESPQPTLSEFDPDNEAMMSTRQLDNQTQKLPALRASAQRYREPMQQEPDYAINTSAIGRAFPDFSQGNTSSNESSISIEVGRGPKKGSYGTIGKLGRPRERSSRASTNREEDSMDFSAPINGIYQAADTLPLRQKPANDTIEALPAPSRQNKLTRRASSLRTEIEPSPPAKTKDYGSGESRKASDGSRRGLAAMHARLREEDDLSKISDERPPTVDGTVRNTRFGNSQPLPDALSDGLPTRFSTTKGLLHPFKPANRPAANTASTPQATQQSFMLPDLPNISELVSGVFEDGTPVFSRQGRSRASRFAFNQSKLSGQNHAAAAEIAVPDDEQAIFLSLKLLQDKVAVLEKDKVEAETAIRDLKEKNRQLQAEKSQSKRARHRSDSALGTTDSDEGTAMFGGQRKAIIEKNRLESSIRQLSAQLDASNRKASTAETIIQNITHERDSAISQLSVAYVTMEELKAENESLKEENTQLKGRVGQLTDVQQRPVRDHGSQQGIEHRKDSLMHKAQDTGDIASRSQGENAPRTQSTHHMQAPKPGHRQSSAAKDDDDLFDLTPRHCEEVGTSAQKRVSHPNSDDDLDSEGSVSEGFSKDKSATKRASSVRCKGYRTESTSRDLTYLSFVNSEEIAKLRKTLEQERIEQKQRKAARRQLLQQDGTRSKEVQYETQEQPLKAAVPRKSSMKDITSKSDAATLQACSASNGANAKAGHTRRQPDTSIHSTLSHRRGVDGENMTSAFILPDITIRAPKGAFEKLPELTKENRAALDKLTKHDRKNCTVCKRTVDHGKGHECLASAKGTITVPKPVPVSERLPEATPDEDEPTIRPAQAPGLALATVLKGLEDELSHCKMKLSQYQALYNSHDPSLSKRKRKSCYQTMEMLLKLIEVKADQIYALYDVLEGQKQDGQDLTEEQVEITLQSLGMDIPGVHLRGGGQEEKGEEDEQQKERHPWELRSEEGSDEDLPWEGVESTIDTTKSGYATGRGRGGTSTA
ncbi:MAG: hypothetical protein Q9163_002139 [Psora crenata]